MANNDAPIKILMIGNSFSISCMPHLPKTAAALGIKLDLMSLYIGGCSLERHWNNIEACEIDPSLKQYRSDRNVLCGETAVGEAAIAEALASDKWDIVTIQQASHQSWIPESYHPYGDNVVKTIRKYAPQAEVVVQETWSYTPFDHRLADWGITPDEMYTKLHEAYGAFAAGYGFRVIPMGTAVQAFRKALPVKYATDSFGGDVVGGRGGNPLPDCDVFHLNEDGEYLQALVWAAKLFGKDPRLCEYVPEWLSQERASLLKRVAYETVAK